MELQFQVTRQNIKRTDGNSAVADSVNYLTAEFNFESSDWDNTTKTATFRSGATVYTVILDANGKCVVPWELIKAGKLKVSVYGDGANEYRITADTVDIPIYASGYSEGEESQHPTPSQYEQLTGALSQKLEASNLKTINGQSIVGSGNLVIEGSGTEVVANPEGTATESLTKIQIGEDIFNIPSGGSGGTSDYTDLTNKPSINGTTLSGNKTSSDLGLQSALTFDNSPTSESNNPVKSGGIYTALDGKVDKANGKGLSTNDYTNADKTKLDGLSQVTANPTLAGTESDLTGLQIGDTKFKVPSGGGSGTTVVANPTLVGTEDDLTGLQVGSTKFKIPSGGVIDNPPVDPNPEYKTPVIYPHEHWLIGGATSGQTSVGDPCRMVNNSSSNVTTYSVDIEPGETITITVVSANNKRVGLFNGTTAEVMANYSDARGTFLAYETSSTLPSPDYTLTYKNETNATQAYFFYMTNSTPPAGHSFEVTSDVQINTVVYPSVNVAFEYMGFDANGEVNDNYTDASSASTDYQTKRRSVGRYRVKAGTSLKVAIPDGISAFYVYEFTAKNEFVSKTQLTSNTWKRTGSTTTYVAFEYVFSSNKKSVNKNISVQWYGEKPIFAKRPMFSGIKNFVYDVTGNRDRSNSSSSAITPKHVYTTGRLQLPVNYSEDGESIKLIIFCHSSSSFQTWNASGFSQTASASLIQYLVDEGYAVYDSYGRSSDMEIKYPNNKHVFGTVDNMNCLVSGYKWVIDNYNIDKNGCYTMCKSLGGLQALNLCWSAVPVKACSALAPALDPLSRGGGYTNGERAENAEVLEYSGDTTCLESSIPLSSGAGTIPDMSSGSAYRTLMSANKEKWIGYIPMWNGLTDSDIDNLLEWTYADMTSGQASVSDHGTTMDIMKGDQTATNWANLHRFCKTPIKIWSALDDENVPYSTAQNFIKTLQNGNCIAELRTMPSGTGGHLSVDTSESALKQSGTTRNGITFTDIASAYVEAVEFFRRFE